MLNKTENLVMSAVFQRCGQSGCCLVTLSELETLLKRHKIKENKIRSCLRSLELDDYLDLITCARHGEEVYCINLRQKGFSFKRERQVEGRMVINKIVFAVLSALITFAVGQILFYFFT